MYKNLCFVHIPKTGGVSICKALGIESAHYPASYYAKNFPNCKRFTVIRGKRDRLLSSHDYHVKNRSNIKFFVDSLETQSLPLDYWLDVPCHYYLRFEKLQEDFDKMMDELGHERIKLERLNTSK